MKHVLTPYHVTQQGKIYLGNSLEVLKALPHDSVDNCITSPPYWGLRDYGHDDQIGLEHTPEQYVSNLVDLFREVKRVLKDHGTLWLNLGDTYASNREKSTDSASAVCYNTKAGVCAKRNNVTAGYKHKDLIGIPWRVAFALQADGWYLRQDIVWHKPNPMPESVTDRCTKSHEYIFLLSKSKHYYFDHKAIQEPANYDGRLDTRMKGSGKYGVGFAPVGVSPNSMTIRGHERWQESEDGSKVRNKRSVWTVATKPFKGAHFAAYPLELILPMVNTAKSKAVILDPFLGSGTTALAAIALSRKYIGIELNPQYAEMAANRIDTELDQTRIAL